MDAMRDKAEFAKLLDGLCATWNRPPASSELQETYWKALRDVRLSEVRAAADRVVRLAGKRDPFPKPAELRDVPPSDVRPDDRFDDAVRCSTRNLERLRAEAPDAWRNDVWLRKLDRTLATEDESSPIYAQALEESRVLRPKVRGY